MRKFKELVKAIYEATGAASKAAALRFTRSREPAPIDTGREVYPSGFPEDPLKPGQPYNKQTYLDRYALSSGARDVRDRRKAAAAAKGAAEGEAKQRAAAELAARITVTKQQASEGTGVKKQIENLKAGETIGVDLVDGGFGYVHHDGDTGIKFFAKGNRERAHPIHSTPVQPDHVQITTPKKSGKNIQFPVVGKIHHRDATPVKSGRIDRRTGAFITDHDINT
jgi:hypothetical protein